MNEEIQTIEDRVVKLLERMVSALPDGSADFRVKRAPEIRHGGVSVWLTPSEPKAAQIVADAKNGDSTVTLSLGLRTPVEIVPRRGRAMTDDIRDVCGAVFDGRFEEDLWLLGSEITKSVGKIEYGGRAHVFKWYGGFFPFRKKERRHIKYSPYFRAGASMKGAAGG